MGDLYDSDVVKGNLKVFGWAFGILFDSLQESSEMIKMASQFFISWPGRPLKTQGSMGNETTLFTFLAV